MATYTCHCCRPADVFLREVRDTDGQPIPRGKSWAVCTVHVGHVMTQFVGSTIRVYPVSRTWAEHVARRKAENEAKHTSEEPLP